MRAAVLVEHGRPPVVQDHAEPSVPAGWLLVEVTAAPVVPLDLLVAGGTSYFGTPALPYVPGVQGVGRVAGEQQRRVWFTTDAGMRPGDGSMAQRVAVDPTRVLDLHQAVPDTTVAALGLSAVAADGALRRGRLAVGESVLVLGASGVVGSVALQLALARGAGRVVAAVRGEHAVEQAAGLGAHAVVDLAAGSDVPAVETLRRRFADVLPQGADLVVDPVWGAPAEAALAVLAPGGRLVNLGDTAGPTAALSSAVVRSRSVELLGYTNLARPWDEQRQALSDVLELAAAGSLRVEHAPVPLERAALAWVTRGPRQVLVP